MNDRRDHTGDFVVQPKRPARRFRTRVFFYLLILSLATSVVSGATYYSRQVKFIERDRARRAHTLLTSLATQAELGAYASDASLCDLPARRTFGEEDVVLVGVYDPLGKEILRMTSPSVGLPPSAPMAALAPLLHNPDAPPVRVTADGYDDLWTPIVTTARPAAVAVASEPGGGAPREVVGLARVGLSLVPAREQLEEVVRTGIYLSVGLLLLGSLAALLIAGAISDPILALARGADEIRAGNFDVTIDVRAQDEVGLLAESFNRMAAKLRDTMAELEALNRNLESEVMRRTDEIRRSAEFTELLNAPIERDAAASAASDLDKLLENAVDSLRGAIGVRSAAILLSKDEIVELELRLAATSGAFPAEFDELPTEAELAPGKPILHVGRATIPILFRGEPEGAIVLHDEPVLPHAIEFAARAAGPLAIAISNVRAYAALKDLAHELTERNQALVKQRDQLSEMNRLKSEFLANVSHELRTPLNAVLGYTELIAEGIYGETTSEQQEALEGIEESSRNLLTLINQILDLSKVESGKIELYVTEVEVHDLAQSVVSEAQALAKARPYKLQVVCATRVVIKTDGAKLKQILTNLVTNAIKFTDHGGVVVLVTPQENGGCAIAVRDTGIGIRTDDQQLIFEEFRQVDGSSTRRYSGTGLGLSIARRFAHLLSGTLTVDSQLGVGSTFTLRLPAEPRPAGRPPTPPLPPARITAKLEAQSPSAGRSK